MSRSGSASNFTIEGRPPVASGDDPSAQWRVINPDYLGVLRIPLLRGRAFTERDAAGAPGVALINRALARRHFGDTDPVGQRIRVWGETRQIVGIVGDVHHYGLDEAPSPELYMPTAQEPVRSMFLTLRTRSDPTRLAATVRREIAGLDPDVAVGEVRSMDRVVAEFTSPERLMTGMLGAFAAAALLIAAIGIYGVIAYTVAQRTREIGVRVALGAEPRDVLRLVVGQGMALAGIGIAVGGVGALGVTRFMQSFLYGVSTTDPAMFGVGTMLLAGVALLASYLPARRATRVDPMVVLRAE